MIGQNMTHWEYLLFYFQSFYSTPSTNYLLLEYSDFSSNTFSDINTICYLFYNKVLENTLFHLYNTYVDTYLFSLLSRGKCYLAPYICKKEQLSLLLCDDIIN